VPQRVKLNKLNRLVDFFAIGVPLLYLPVRFLAKDTVVGFGVERTWEVLAGALLVLTFLKINQRWQERAEEHSRLLGENIAIAGQADNLLRDIEHVSGEAASLFFLLAQRSEAADRNALGEPSTAERQRAYREGLKEAQWDCPKCTASPTQQRDRISLAA
jgi:mobilome CxxCx(11)CxxC protein